MARRLLLLRHAKSSWKTAAGTDFERPLNTRGQQDAPRVGSWLREQGLLPDYVVSSPAERAKQTVLKAARELELKKKDIHWDPRIYEAGLDTLLAVLADCPREAQTVLLVGHNPSLDYLLEYLCPSLPTTDDGKMFTTAAVAELDMPDEWGFLAAGSARLVALTRPRPSLA